MLISQLINGMKDAYIEGEDININGLAYNTKEIKKGDLFFCIQGFKTDGHLFAEKAVELGAAALVVSKDVEVNKNITKVFVKDTREAMAVMASNFYGNPSDKINTIGITGTSGKTTSSFMINSILKEANKKTALLGTIYNIFDQDIEEAKRTTPESLDLQGMFKKMTDQSINSCVMEISSHSLELKRVYGVKFKVGVFTNLTQDHLDFHKTMENYFHAKMKLFDNAEYAVINADDEYGQRAVKTLGNKIITYGINNKADFEAKNIRIDERGSYFDLLYKDKVVPIEINLIGKFNIYNALCSIAACSAFGIPMDDIVNGLKKLKNVIGRSEKIISSSGFTILIDFAHTPNEIKNILKTAREYTKNKLVIVFGCGGDRDKAKRPIMGKIAGELSDFCVVTSDNPRSEQPEAIIDDILVGVKQTNAPYVVIPDRKSAIKYAIDNAKSGDVIVLAGKGHEKYQILNDKTIPFDEREIVEEILRRE